MAEKGIKGNTDRIKLEEHIPLDTPLHVFLDASSVCNFHCSFCPHGNGEAAKVMPQTIMPVELAKKCIDDMTEFPQKIKRISFFDHGEPLVNSNLEEIISYAKNKNISDYLCITTNASLLTYERAEKIINAGLNRIDISIYGLSNKTYREFSHNQMDFEKLVKQISDCYDLMKSGEIVIKITDAALENQEDYEKFYNIFSPICDKICIEHAVPFWYDLDLKIDYDEKDIYGNPVVYKEICPVPFYALSIQANGLITPCCSDWKNILVLGDANKESIFSVWNGMNHKELCKTLLKNGNKSVEPCNRCRFHELVAMDNIDEYRDVLLKRMEE